MRRRSGDLLQRLVADIDTLDHIYLRLVSPCAVAVFAAAAVLIYLAFFDAAAAVFAAAALFLTGAVVALAFGRLVERAGQRMTASSARLRTRIVEGMLGMAELLVFGALPAVRERIGQDQQALLGAQRQMNRLTGAANALVVLVSGLAALGVLWIGAAGAADRRISPAVLVLMVFAVVGAFESIFPLAAAFPFLGRTRAAARRLQQLASPAPTIRFPDAGPARLAGRDLCFERVAFRYAAQDPPVFDGLDLVLARGGKMALMGPTGAGKSTLVHLMCRFWDPD